MTSTVCFHSYGVPREIKFTEIHSRRVLAMGWGGVGEGVNPGDTALNGRSCHQCLQPELGAQWELVGASRKLPVWLPN